MVIQSMSYRFTVEDFQRMGNSSLFRKNERVELIEGEIITMTPIGNRHAGCVLYLSHIFARKLGNRALVNVQNPLELDEFSEPQPDITLLKPREDFYREGHPRPGDVFLIVEVTASAEDYDRDIKLPLYARHGIPEFWIVDLLRKIIEVYRDPAGQQYQSRTNSKPGDMISTQTFPDVSFSVQDIVR